jgi:hypothetical protein
VNWVGIVAFLLGLVAGWTGRIRLVTPLQVAYVVEHTSWKEPTSVGWSGIVLAGGVYLIGDAREGRPGRTLDQRMAAVAGGSE